VSIREAAEEIYKKTTHMKLYLCERFYCKTFFSVKCDRCRGRYEEEITRIMGIIEKVNKWVSVNDRLPEKQDDYLMVLDSSVAYGFFDKLGYWLIMNRDYIDLVVKPTHWMPLPDLPKEPDA